MELVLALRRFDEGFLPSLLFDPFWPLEADGLGSTILLALTLQRCPGAQISSTSCSTLLLAGLLIYVNLREGRYLLYALLLELI